MKISTFIYFVSRIPRRYFKKKYWFPVFFRYNFQFEKKNFEIEYTHFEKKKIEIIMWALN